MGGSRRLEHETEGPRDRLGCLLPERPVRVGFAGTRRSGDERRQPDRDDGARVRGFTTSGYRRTSELCQVGDAAAGLAAREPSV